MLDDLKAERKRKLEKLQAAHQDPYPARVARTHTIGEAQQRFDELATAQTDLALVGRITSIRDQGGVLFFTFEDATGNLQAVAKKQTTKDFDLLQSTLDRGDFVSVRGPLFKTERGTESIDAQEIHIAAKSLLPLPQEHFGLKDKETLLRKRYLDILTNPDTKDLFVKKAKFWNAMRAFMKDAGFLEVETPVLELLPGGAEAEPFKTHHNSLGEDVYLRIALELWLKRLMVAGYEKVFEIGRIFRNEGMSAEHLQDFTTMELYWAYQDYNGLMDFIEQLYRYVIKETMGSLTTTRNGETIDWAQPWPRLDYAELFQKENGIDCLGASAEELYKRAQELHIEQATATLGRGRLIDLIYKKTVRPKLIQPCFLINHPVETSPLAKRNAEDPRRVERFQPLAAGTEIGNGFSELNDPLDQRARFEEQMKLREAGDLEAQWLDEDYLEAMEYGMPPTAGFGAGDRLFAVLVDKPIRETILFPLVRSKEE
jgi:lysyl-tRNA synthetase class 2